MFSRRRLGTVAALGAAAVAAPSVARAQTAHKWKMQSLWQAGSVNQKVFEDFAKRVKEASGGRIEIEPLPVGTDRRLHARRSTRCTNGVLDWPSQRRRLTSPARSRPWRCSATSTAASRTPTRCRCGSSTAAGSNWRATSTSASTSIMSGRSGGASSRCRRRSRCARSPISRASRCGCRKGLGAEIWRRAGVGVVTLPGQRGLHGARARRDRGDRLGHARHEQRPRLPQDREVPAVSRIPLDAVRGGGDQHGEVERALARTSRRSSRSRCAISRATWCSASPWRTSRWRAGAKAAGVELDRHGLRKSAASSASSSQQAWADWAKKSPAAKKVYDSQMAFLKKIGLLLTCEHAARRPGRGGPLTAPRRFEPAVTLIALAAHARLGVPGRRRAHRLRSADALRLQQPTIWVHDLVIVLSALRLHLRRRLLAAARRAHPHRVPSTTACRRVAARLRPAQCLAIIVFWRSFGWRCMPPGPVAIELGETSGRAWDVPIPAFLKTALAARRRADDPAGDRQSETHLAAGPPMSVHT